MKFFYFSNVSIYIEKQHILIDFLKKSRQTEKIYFYIQPFKRS